MNLQEWCVESIYEKLLDEWNYNKNGSLTPESVTPKSHKKVWWICPHKHEWEAAICSRTSGTQCPYCFGQRPIVGYNDLATLYPSIVTEWHPTKNGTLNPSLFKAKSNKKVWWECSMCGHEWEASISKRTDRQGCPECAKEWRISFPEKAIVYYLKQVGLALEENYHAEWLQEFDLDIYIPSLNLGISYDGPLHQNLKKELRKNFLCENNNTYLIRICDPKSVFINSSLGLSIRQFDRKNSSLNTVISILLKELEKLYSINIPESFIVDVDRDRISIYELMKMHRKNHSIAYLYPHLLEEWNYEKNFSLKPEFLLPGSEKKIWWRCKKTWTRMAGYYKQSH